MECFAAPDHGGRLRGPPLTAGLSGELGGDVDSDGAEAQGGSSERQGELAILAVLFQALEKAVFLDSADLAKPGEPGFVA